MYKKVLLSKVHNYLTEKKIDYRKSGKIIITQCPKCNHDPISATLIPNTHILNCTNCNEKSNLLDLVRAREDDKKNMQDEDIFLYLRDLFNIDIQTEKEADTLKIILGKYKEYGFDLVPIAKNDKRPIESEWTKKHHTNIDEWENWIGNGINIGVKTGKISNITIVDIDAVESGLKKKIYDGKGTEEDLVLAKKQKEEGLAIANELFEGIETLKQDTFGGAHLIFKYVSDLPKTSFKYKGVNFDMENDGGQVVIAPSKVGGKERVMEFHNIAVMPEKLVEEFKKNISTPKKTHSEQIVEDIQTEDFVIGGLEEGNRNNGLLKLGGILRKQLNPSQTQYALRILNKHLVNPSLPDRDLYNICNSLDKYVRFDEQDLASQIISYLKVTEFASKAEIEIAVLDKRAVGEDKKLIDKLLVYLMKEEKIIRQGRNYKLVTSMEWTDTLLDIGIPIDFKVPYLHDYAFFNWGDLIIIGSQNKYGKTTLAMNVVQELVNQGIKPYYIYSESGGRFGKTAVKLGMKDGDFWKVHSGKPEEVKIEKNSIVIYDWVRPTGGFNTTDELYDKLVQKLEKTQSFMICFVQLKKDNEWFAPNMITQYPALACKYLYEDGSDGTDTYFHITEVREAKVKGKEFKIPCRYDWDEKKVIRVETNNEM